MPFWKQIYSKTYQNALRLGYGDTICSKNKPDSVKINTKNIG